MRLPTISYVALGALVAALGCSKSLDTMAKPDQTAVQPDTTQTAEGYKGQQRDTAMVTDTAASNQTKSGVTDTSGTSTLGPGATQTRPDQGQPVTSKGDTLNPAVDSSAAAQPAPGATTTGVDTSAAPTGIDTTAAPAGATDSTAPPAGAIDTTGSMAPDTTAH